MHLVTESMGKARELEILSAYLFPSILLTPFIIDCVSHLTYLNL